MISSRFSHIFHATVPKAGSVWFSALFMHPWVTALSAMEHVNFGDWQLRETGQNAFERLDGPKVDIMAEFGERKLLSPVYCTPQYFSELCAPLDNYAAVAVIRDPRDLIVSQYFSLKHSHPVVGRQDKFQLLRERLNTLPMTEGMVEIMRQNMEVPYHASMRGWAALASKNSRLMVIKFEDAFGPGQLQVIEAMFQHCDILFPPGKLEELLTCFRFETFSGGRPAGVEDVSAHWRKGKSGDWKNHFDEALRRTYVELFGDLPEQLGYEPTLSR